MRALKSSRCQHQQLVLTFALSFRGCSLSGCGDAQCTLCAVACRTQASLPLALWAGCNLARGLQVIPSRNHCTIGKRRHRHEQQAGEAHAQQPAQAQVQDKVQAQVERAQAQAHSRCRCRCRKRCRHRWRGRKRMRSDQRRRRRTTRCKHRFRMRAQAQVQGQVQVRRKMCTGADASSSTGAGAQHHHAQNQAQTQMRCMRGGCAQAQQLHGKCLCAEVRCLICCNDGHLKDSGKAQAVQAAIWLCAGTAAVSTCASQQSAQHLPQAEGLLCLCSPLVVVPVGQGAQARCFL